MVQQTTPITLSSLYSSGQCLLSVLGSIGVILLFAGIPQLIYSTPVNPGSLMTFLLGAILICLMVAGNAFIGYKYRQLVRARREESRNANPSTSQRDDKPPSYDDLIQEDGSPPDYASIIIKEKPPRYEDLVAEVYNWPTIAKVHETGPKNDHHPITSSMSVPTEFAKELPIIVPLHRNLSQHLEPTQPKMSPQFNLGYAASSDDLKEAGHSDQPVPSSSSQTSATAISTRIQQHIRRSKSNVSNMLSLMGGKASSSSASLQEPSVKIVNEVKTATSSNNRLVMMIDDNSPSLSDDNSSHL